jgi:hypothetical protein
MGSVSIRPPRPYTDENRIADASKATQLNLSYKELLFYATRPTNNDDNKTFWAPDFECAATIFRPEIAMNSMASRRWGAAPPPRSESPQY